MHEDRRHRIEVRAYLMWEQAGRPDGRSEEFWLLAEQELERAESPGQRSADVSASRSQRARTHAASGGKTVAAAAKKAASTRGKTSAAAKKPKGAAKPTGTAATPTKSAAVGETAARSKRVSPLRSIGDGSRRS